MTGMCGSSLSVGQCLVRMYTDVEMSHKKNTARQDQCFRRGTVKWVQLESW